MCPRSIAGVPSSQVLPGYLITAPPSVCVPSLLGALAVWIQNHKKKLGWLGVGERYDFSLPEFFCTADPFPGTSLSQRWREFFARKLNGYE